MSEWLDLFEKIGVPSGIAGFIILVAVVGDSLLKRFAESRRADGEDSREERRLLASDQADFRRSLIEQNQSLRGQMQASHEALERSVSRQLDAERRVADLQITIARLASVLVKSGVTVPADITGATAGDVHLGSP